MDAPSFPQDHAYQQHPLIPIRTPDAIVVVKQQMESPNPVLYWFFLAGVYQLAGDN
jgi:hypothetical protein